MKIMTNSDLPIAGDLALLARTGFHACYAKLNNANAQWHWTNYNNISHFKKI